MKKIIVLLALSFFALTGMAMAFNTKSIDPGKKVLYRSYDMAKEVIVYSNVG
jgi:hypothetical protein